MPYPARLLNDGETVVADFHPHWIYFGEAVAAHLKTVSDSPESVKFSNLYHRLGRLG